MSHLDTAYKAGAHDARIIFEKRAAGEITTPLLGAIPGMGPALAGAAGGATTPHGSPWDTGYSAASGSLLGQVGGGLGGALLGGLGGYGLSKLRGEDNPSDSVGTGLSVGGLLGLLGGGAYGAHKGREAGIERAKAEEDRQERLIAAVNALQQQGR